MNRLELLAIVSLMLAAPAASATGQSSIPQGLREYVLGDRSDIRIVAYVATEASFADSDWFQIEVTNRGAPATIKSATILAPTIRESTQSSGFLGSLTLGTPPSRDGRGSMGHVLPTGRWLTSSPGERAANSYAMRRERPFDVVLDLSINLVLDDGRSFSMDSPLRIAFTWKLPTGLQLQRLQQDAVDLLDQLVSASLPNADFIKLNHLLRTPLTAQRVTLDAVLRAVRKRQVDDSFGDNGALSLIFQRWPDDPRVIAFYRDALVARPAEALNDLAYGKVWDPSFIELTVGLIEAAATSRRPQLLFGRAFTFLDRHYDDWSGNRSIPARLGTALVQARTAFERSGLYSWFQLIPKTHDQGMLAILEPILDDHTIDDYTSMSSMMPTGRTPMRYSELAANAISELLGEPLLFDPWKRAPAARGGPYPEWEEWDAKLELLKRRLRTLKR